MSETVAFYGAGMLGSGFVKSLRRRGVDVHVWNRTYERALALETDGARAFRDAAQAARGASRVHICVRDDAAVDAILNDALEGIAKDAVIVDHTTVLPQSVAKRAQRLSSEGYTFLHAPVFMGPANALNATGTMLASGPRETFERVRPALEIMTGKLEYFGERGDLAAVYKLMGNAMIIAVVGGLNDVFRIGEVQGLTRDEAFRLFNFYSPEGQITGRGRRMADEDYSPTWTLDMAHKDLTLMQGAAKGEELPSMDAMEALLARREMEGLGALDVGALAKR